MEFFILKTDYKTCWLNTDELNDFINSPDEDEIFTLDEIDPDEYFSNNISMCCSAIENFLLEGEFKKAQNYWDISKEFYDDWENY